MPLHDATRLQDRYQLKKRLGANGGKQTWLTVDDATGKEVTVKALYFGQGMEWQDLKLFEREAQTLKSLSHPRIPRYQDSFWLEQPEGNYFCLVQDYIPGISLAEKVRGGWRLDDAEVEKVATSILEILVYLHGQNPPVIHRDIKPNNLIWGEDNQVYLVDFGAVQAEVSSGRTMTVVGTYGYMPPEQFGGRTVPASDLYGLGTTLLFLLTGTNPADLPQKDLKVQFQDRVRVGQPLKQWLERMVEPSLDRRFRDAEEALTFLKKKNSLSSGKTAKTDQIKRSVKPLGTIVELERTPEQLDIEIPSRPFHLRDAPGLVFAGVWLAFILVWSSLAIRASFLFALFSLPFWAVGLFLLGTSLWPILGRTKIHIDHYAYEIIWGIKGLLTYRVTGKTKALTGARIQSNFKVNDRDVYYCALRSTTKQYPFAFGLNPFEQEWLVSEIEGWLEQNSQAE
ncbi:MAG: serine/threonine-protein kinase [Gloeobacterales cyanobacterium]